MTLDELNKLLRCQPMLENDFLEQLPPGTRIAIYSFRRDTWDYGVVISIMDISGGLYCVTFDHSPEDRVLINLKDKAVQIINGYVPMPNTKSPPSALHLKTAGVIDAYINSFRLRTGTNVEREVALYYLENFNGSVDRAVDMYHNNQRQQLGYEFPQFPREGIDEVWRQFKGNLEATRKELEERMKECVICKEVYGQKVKHCMNPVSECA